MYNHFQKMRMQQFAQGKGKIVLSVDICCIGTSSKTACKCALKLIYCLIEMYGKGALLLAKMYPS